MKKLLKIKRLVILCSVLVLCICSKAAARMTTNNINSDETNDINNQQGDKTMNLLINGQYFNVHLYDNPATDQLLKLLPMTLLMNDLHQNEKYQYLDNELITNSESIQLIKAGDLMLFGNDCLVLFYETFTTSYQYTRIGSVKNIERLKECLGNKEVEITFQTGQ